MKIRHPFLLTALTASMLTACSDHWTVTEPASELVQQVTKVQQGMLSIKLNADIVAQIDGRQNELALPTGIATLDDYLQSIGARRMRRIFPHAGKDETRQAERRLNAWYTVWYSDTAASSSHRAPTAVDIADIIEPVRIPVLENYRVYPAPAMSATTSRAATKGPFDDPLFPAQWNLKNSGNFGNYTNSKGEHIVSSVEGADINVEPAWHETTGDSRVIIAVVDGGVDTAHEDLAESMWVNSGEIPDNGIDDDNNGYVDDIHGWNFVDDSPVIIPTDHGTHVAGIIAARNNNGVGICGVAGGNGSPDSGVRLMTCQIFKPNPDYDPDDPESRSSVSVEDYNAMAAAIVYGANNGAVISQNSWGFSDYEPAPQVVEEAISYFNSYAGHYAGSPMQGGITIHSAGNDATEQPEYPAAYDNVISVAAFAPDWAAAWYTNYGQTVNLCAPGGTSPQGDKYPYASGFQLPSLILSTVPQSVAASGYASMQGSSMACPHVSGVAALIVSKYGGDDFTSDQLRQRLLRGIHPLDPNEHNGAKYRDRLGMGYVSAAAALADHSGQGNPPTPRFTAEVSRADYYALHVGWSVDVERSGDLQYFTLYYASSPIDASRLDADHVHHYVVPAGFVAAGHHDYERTLSGLSNHQTYYFALSATAADGTTSPVVMLPDGLTTLTNTAPRVSSSTNLNTPIHLFPDGHYDLELLITDAEHHHWTYSLVNRSIFYIEEEGERLMMRLFANKFGPGEHTVTLTVTDEYGAETVVPIKVFKEAAPAGGSDDENKDETGEDTAPAVVGNGLVSLYPTEADLYVMVVVGNDIEGAFTLRIRNALGKQVREQQLDTAMLDPRERNLLVDVSQLFPGRYSLSIMANGHTYTKTFIKK